MIRLLIASIAFFFVEISLAQSLERDIERLIDNSSVPRSHLGLSISEKTSLKETKKLFSSNEDKPFIPASVTKLVTASAALRFLTLEKSFETQLATDGQVDKNGTLNGDLYFIGSGDPGFVSENLWNLVNNLTRLGVKKVQGQIIMDCHIFDDILVDPGRDRDDSNQAYNAPLSGCNFNWNSVNIYARPGNIGQKPILHLDPANEYFNVINRATTTRGAGVQLRFKVETPVNGKESLVVDGNIGVMAKGVLAYRNIDQPNPWSAMALKTFLSQRNIDIDPNILFRSVDLMNKKILATTSSEPLFDSVKDMMKYSNNLIAEALTKQISAASGEKPATMNKGLDLINNHIRNLGVTPSDLKIENSAGLSRKNRFKPEAMTRFLEKLMLTQKQFPELLSSLPIGGIDGTLKKRLRDPKVKHYVRAKTGTLSGVTSLAGYLTTESGKVRIFSFFYNSRGRNQVQSAKNLFDKILLRLREDN